MHLVARYLLASVRPVMDHQQQYYCVEQKASELHSAVTAEFYPENEPPTLEQLKLRVKQQPLLQRLGEAQYACWSRK